MSSSEEQRSASAEAVESAARRLALGGVVVFPTETVYGVGASVRRPDAVERVYAIKQRPRERPLIVHVAGLAAAKLWAPEFPRWAETLAGELWPGPLTVVATSGPLVPSAVTGGGRTVALRAPDHPVTRALLDALRRVEGGESGLAGSSANLFGMTPPTTSRDAVSGLPGAVDDVLEGGSCALGIESTVLDVTGEAPRILRAGAVTVDVVERLCGRPVDVGSDRPPGPDTSESLGGLEVVVVDEERLALLELEAGDYVIARFPPPPASHPAEPGRWSVLPRDIEGFARELYQTMHRLVAHGAQRIFVQRAPPTGVGVAVNARLKRLSGRQR